VGCCGRKEGGTYTKSGVAQTGGDNIFDKYTDSKVLGAALEWKILRFYGKKDRIL
jgi:hypothetical protein